MLKFAKVGLRGFVNTLLLAALGFAALAQTAAGQGLAQPLSVPFGVGPPVPASATQPTPIAESTQDKKIIESVVADYLKKEAEKKKAAEEEKKAEADGKKWYDIFGGTRYDLQSLYDSLSDPLQPRKQLSIRGYTQIRYDRTLETNSGTPILFGDRAINGSAENFFIRRARIIFSGDVHEHVYVYIQPDFASTPNGATTSVVFAQLRDLYTDLYVDPDKVHRFRVGLSKIPYGWENCQSSQNRIPLDRTDAMNTAVAPNERDLGVIYYWTPVEQQKLFKTLVDSGLKGSNNFGMFAFGVYNGQGGGVPEFNQDLHWVSRFTYPWQLANGQVVEASIQGYRGNVLVQGSAIRPLGKGAPATPKNTGANSGVFEERIAATFVWLPQPLGFQTEWQVGHGPGLNDTQTAVVKRPLSGGYLMSMYRHDTECAWGVFTPYVRYQQYTGGYRSQANAPFGNQRQWDFGVEWQFLKQVELVCEYSLINTPNFTALGAANSPQSYSDFHGSTLRFQVQFNY